MRLQFFFARRIVNFLYFLSTLDTCRGAREASYLRKFRRKLRRHRRTLSEKSRTSAMPAERLN